jgi:hypothetical protein
VADSLSKVAVNVRDTGRHRGHVVSVMVGADVVWLDPADAHRLAQRLVEQATEAMHADRAVRRG